MATGRGARSSRVAGRFWVVTVLPAAGAVGGGHSGRLATTWVGASSWPGGWVLASSLAVASSPSGVRRAVVSGSGVSVFAAVRAFARASASARVWAFAAISVLAGAATLLVADGFFAAEGSSVAGVPLAVSAFKTCVWSAASAPVAFGSPFVGALAGCDSSLVGASAAGAWSVASASAAAAPEVVPLAGAVVPLAGWSALSGLVSASLAAVAGFAMASFAADASLLSAPFAAVASLVVPWSSGFAGTAAGPSSSGFPAPR